MTTAIRLDVTNRRAPGEEGGGESDPVTSLYGSDNHGLNV